jgi:hypothetical protein
MSDPYLTESQQATIEEEALKPLRDETEKQLENIFLTENDIIILLKYNDEKQIITFNIQTKQQPSGKAEMFGTFMDTRGKSEFTSDFTSILDTHQKKAGIINLFKAHGSEQKKNKWGFGNINMFGTKNPPPKANNNATPMDDRTINSLARLLGGKKTKSNRSYNANKTLKNRK